MISIETLRQFRIGEYAIFDLTISFFGVYLLAPLFSKIFLKFGIIIPRLSWVLFTLPLAVLVHLLVGNMTQMTKDFIDVNGHYFIKVLIVGMLVWGLRGIKLK